MRERLSIIVDTREQRPYTFPNASIHKKALDVGDYSLRGYQRWIRVERKAFADWHLCISRGAARMRDQLARLAPYRYALLVVEAPLTRRFFYSELAPEGKARITAKLLADFRVPILFACSRRIGQVATENFLRYAKQRIDEHGVEEEA